MKYIVYFLLMGLICIIVSPIILIKWDNGGWDKIDTGLAEMCGVDI